MVKDERDPPPMHFGDYPHDAYWSAERRDQDASYPRRTRSIRLMWDYGVRVPLCDAAGLLPEERKWLRVVAPPAQSTIQPRLPTQSP